MVAVGNDAFRDYLVRLESASCRTEVSPLVTEYLQERLRVLDAVRDRILSGEGRGIAWSTAEVTRHRIHRVLDTHAALLHLGLPATTTNPGTTTAPLTMTTWPVSDAAPANTLPPSRSAACTAMGPTSSAVVAQPQRAQLPAATTVLHVASGAGRGRRSPTASPAAMAPALDPAASAIRAHGGSCPVPARQRRPAKLSFAQLQPPHGPADRATVVTQRPTAEVAVSTPAASAVHAPEGRQAPLATSPSAVMGGASTALVASQPTHLHSGLARSPSGALSIRSKRPSAGDMNVQAVRARKSTKKADVLASPVDLTAGVSTTITTLVWPTLPSLPAMLPCARPWSYLPSPADALLW